MFQTNGNRQTNGKFPLGRAHVVQSLFNCREQLANSFTESLILGGEKYCHQ